MEDYSPSADEVEETPIKKRRFLRGNFLHSWLESRQDEEDDDDDDDEVSETIARTKKSRTLESQNDNWRPERLRDKLRSIFQGLVRLDLVPAAETRESTINDINSSQAELADNLQLTEEEGVLAVSPDAQLRYYGYELMDEPDISEDEPEVEVDNIETDHPIERQQPHPTEFRTVNEQASTIPAEPVGEVLRRRQADRLEQRVKKLKKQTKTIKREQQEVVEQQKDFAKQLTERQKAQERFEKVTVPKMEKAREQLQKRLDRQTPVMTEANLPPSAEITQTKPVEVKTELRPLANLEIQPETKTTVELTKKEQKARQGELQQPLVPGVEEKLPSQNLEERRHEVKDMAGSAISSSVGIPYDRTTTPTPAPSYPPPILPSTFRRPTLQGQELGGVPQSSPKADTGMYQQAVKVGVWGGIALSIALLFVILLMR